MAKKTAMDMVKRAISNSHMKKEYSNLPGKVTDNFLHDLIRDDIAFTASRDVFTAVKEIRGAGDKLVLMPLEHRITAEEGNRIVKDLSLGHYIYLDSLPVVRAALEKSFSLARDDNKAWGLPGDIQIRDVKRVTASLYENTRMYPAFLFEAAFECLKERYLEGKINNPPIGAYWVGPDSIARVLSWSRAIEGHNYYSGAKQGWFKVEMDKEFYGNDTMSFTLPSQTKKGRDYPLEITHIPIFKAKDRKQHSAWRRLDAVDSNPDSRYRGRKDKKRAAKRIFFSAYAIACYDLAASRLRKSEELGEGKIVQINPFPMLTKNGKGLDSRLKEQVLIGKQPANMTERDRLFGADTILHGYQNNFYNWTKR